MLTYDFSLTHDVPSWTYFFAAVCIFIYQTLDACDGKQARKTGSSSPLGQLVDHGNKFNIHLIIIQTIKDVIHLPSILCFCQLFRQ